MDVYDAVWFSEPVAHLSTSSAASPSASPCLSSPSSGYSSSDEGRATPLGPSEAAAADCILSSDPYLGQLVMTPTAGLASRRRVTDAATAIPSTWSGTNLVLDDFMGTLWDSMSTAPPPGTGIVSVSCALDVFFRISCTL